MVFNIKMIVVCLLSVGVFNAYSQEASIDKPFDYGTVENNIYSNSYFDFNMTIPTDWSVQSQEQVDHLSKIGKKLMAGDDEQMKAVLNAVDIQTAYLLAVFKYEKGTAVDYNPGFILISENIVQSPGIKTGSDYLFHARKLMEQSQLKYNHIDSDFKKEVVDGVDFYTMNAEMKYMKLSIKQVYYSTIRNGFAFSVVISYVTKDQKKELLKVIESMQFKD